MSREIRRVPMDFDWPLHKTWTGYLRPAELDLDPCPSCSNIRRSPIERAFRARFGSENEPGDGYTVEARAIADTFYSHMIGGERADELAWSDKIGQAEVDELVRQGRLRVWQSGRWESVPRTAAEVNAEQRRGGLGGHDAINRWILIRFRCERLGIKMECETCGGEGTVGTPEQRKAHDEWERTEPPTGDGYQVWETVSEGSPISPVFNYEGVVAWLMTPHPEDIAFRRGMSRAGAERFIEEGSAITFVASARGVETGVEHLDREARSGE